MLDKGQYWTKQNKKKKKMEINKIRQNKQNIEKLKVKIG